jgi:chromosomal replication initiation ATPase DnaA
VIARATHRVREQRANLPDPEAARLVASLPARLEAFKARGGPAVAPPTARSEAQARQNERERQAKVASLIAGAAVPPRYKDAGLLGNPGARPTDNPGYCAANVALQGLATTSGIVGLIGGRGTGKTWLSCGLVLDFCREGRRAVYTNAFDYFLELRSTFDDGSKMTQERVEAKYVRPALLVLDELHERGDTAWEDRTLTRIVNKRYENNLATVLISNQTPEEFVARVGPSIADRIHDGGGVILCEWASLRGRS